MNNFGILYCMTTLVVLCGGENKWRWPDATDSASVRIDTKIKFLDEHQHDIPRRDNTGRNKQGDSQPLLDEAPFFQATETQGFYNRPPNSGRFPVRVETHQTVYNTPRGNYPHESNNDGIQYCKCVNSPDCQHPVDPVGRCSSGKYLCCYKRLHRQNSEFFNEIEDERPMLYPGQESLGRPFPPPPTIINNQPAVLVGPAGPTGNIGPTRDERVVGPENKGILVGPNGPNGPRLQEPNESAQRGVLVGPGGPTGIIGPAGYGRRQVLVGPGGPTGVIGPRGQGYYGQGYGRQGFGRQAGPGVLVGPGGPTGIIGPGRQILTGPGGPTGVIGPQQNYFGK